MCDKMHGREGKSPDHRLRPQNYYEVKKWIEEARARRWDWKLPSFKESVKAH